MIDTDAEPVADPGTGTDEPHCQALLQCAEKCCDPVPCGRPAAARVSFRCETPNCDRATHVLILCAVCADQAEATVPRPTRRPL